MINSLYEFLRKMGYAHPLHPAFVHGPIGAVIVVFCLGLGFLLWRRHTFMKSAHQVLVIALALYFPTVLAGIIDWQFYYSGEWIFPIKMKIALAVLLCILLFIAIIIGRTPNARPSVIIILFLLCLLDIIGLGYFGGELVYL